MVESKRRVEVVVICEDKQHGAFIRRFLEKRGYEMEKVRVKKSPAGRGSAEKWVLDNFIKEIQEYRRKSARDSHRVILMRDGDGRSVKQRTDQLVQACKELGCEPRRKEERVAVFVPCRNIETWIAYLGGETVDESTEYPRLDRERECQNAVVTLIEMCDRNQLREPAPPSLHAACKEYNERLH